MKRLKKRLSTEGLETGEEDHFHLAFSYETSWLENRISLERSELLLNALNQLPGRQKEAIFLRFYEGLSFAEIAAVMEVEQTSVYKVIYKGFAALPKKVSLRGLLTLSVLLPAGATVFIRGGTYRETVTPTNNNLTFWAYTGGSVTASALDVVTSPWTQHAGSVYKTTFALTQGDKNQVFVDGAMGNLAR